MNDSLRMHDESKILKESYQGARVLVLGASGFIGRWVSRLLIGTEAQLVLVARKKEKLVSALSLFPNERKQIIVDLAEPHVLRSVFERAQPDITFNLTGYGIARHEVDENKAWRINAELVEEIAGIIAMSSPSKWKGLRFVHVGSGFEYGSVKGDVVESTPPNPVSVYGKSKLEGTRRLVNVIAKTGLPALTARLFTVYGPGENKERLLPSLLRIRRTGESLKLTGGKQKRDFTYVKDAAFGLLRLGMLPFIPGGIVNLASGSLTTVKDFVTCAQATIGLEPNQLLFGVIPYRKDELQQGRVDIRFLERCSGWSPTTSVAEGIMETANLERTTGNFD